MRVMPAPARAGAVACEKIGRWRYTTGVGSGNRRAYSRAFPDANLTVLVREQQVLGEAHRQHLRGDIAVRGLLSL